MDSVTKLIVYNLGVIKKKKKFSPQFFVKLDNSLLDFGNNKIFHLDFDLENKISSLESKLILIIYIHSISHSVIQNNTMHTKKNNTMHTKRNNTMHTKKDTKFRIPNDISS